MLILFYKFTEKLNVLFSKFKKEQRNKILLRSIKEKGTIGNNVNFGSDVVISGIENLKIGNNVSIGSGCFIRADGGLTIGDNVVISRNLVLYTNSHNYEGKCLPFDTSYLNSSVVIENNVWIGMNVTISPGTEIGEGAIIGLGTRLFGKIPKLTIVGSQPPKIIKSRDKGHYVEMVENQSFGDNNGKILE